MCDLQTFSKMFIYFWMVSIHITSHHIAACREQGWVTGRADSSWCIFKLLLDSRRNYKVPYPTVKAHWLCVSLSGTLQHSSGFSTGTSSQEASLIVLHCQSSNHRAAFSHHIVHEPFHFLLCSKINQPFFF